MELEHTMKAILKGKRSEQNPSVQLESMSPLTLAYMGDVLFEIFVRDYLLRQPQTSVHQLHHRTVTYVNASAQALMVRDLMPHLSVQEAEIVRRGRNGKTGSVPRNASIVEYRYATGFEALLGWLYYRDEISRLLEIMTQAVHFLEKALQKEDRSHEAI